MIDLYTWSTPNGYKASIMLEETALPYSVFPIDIGGGDQFDEDFLKISPNNKIPAIVDHQGPDGEPFSLFESGAILMYLAEKTGRFMPGAEIARHQTIQWLMFQMGGLGPMLGQCHHFRHYAPEEIPYAIERYTRETARLYGVMDRRLGDSEYLAGDYSIADMACYPWINSYQRQDQDLNDFANVKRWFESISARPAVQKGMKIPPRKDNGDKPIDEKARAVLFGDEQYKKR